MGASAELARLHRFLSERHIPISTSHNSDLILPDISSVQETHRESDNPNLSIVTAPSLLLRTRPYREKLAIMMDFGETYLGLDLSVTRHGTYRELERWKRRKGADWPEHLAEKVRVSTVLIGRHSLSVTGVGLASHVPLKVDIDLANGRVRQSLVTPSVRHPRAA